MLWCLLGAKYVWREVGCASEKLPETKFELHSFCFLIKPAAVRKKRTSPFFLSPCLSFRSACTIFIEDRLRLGNTKLNKFILYFTRLALSLQNKTLKQK